jgi:enoyl-CoA hydratase/carnithine racemase
MDSNQLLTEVDDAVLRVTFNRPAQHNAMTWEMYDGLVAACAQADTDPSVKVMVLRGAGDQAFVAGTDIGQFAAFTDGQDGVAYERRITEVVDRIEAVTVPTVAQVRGFCLGGGLIIAAACDVRVATHEARFGVPIARTLGNCLSMNSCSLLLHHLGPARTMDLLLRARMLSGDEAHAAGFVNEVCEDEDLEGEVAAVVDTMLGHAPLTMWAARQALRRLRLAALPDGDDVVERVFGSEDFRSGVAAFRSKTPAVWVGR